MPFPALTVGDNMAIRLKTRTPQEVRKTLTRIMNMVANYEIDPKRANTIILGCNAVLASIRTDEQQKKLEELEALVNEALKK